MFTVIIVIYAGFPADRVPLLNDKQSLFYIQRTRVTLMILWSEVLSKQNKSIAYGRNNLQAKSKAAWNIKKNFFLWCGFEFMVKNKVTVNISSLEYDVAANANSQANVRQTVS